MGGIYIPPAPLHTNETLDKADAETDKTNDNKHKEKLVTLSSQSANKGGNPRDSTRNKATNRCDYVSHEKPPLDFDKTLDKADAETDEANDDEDEQQRIAGYSSDELTYPANRSSHQRSDIRNNSSHTSYFTCTS